RQPHKQVKIPESRELEILGSGLETCDLGSTRSQIPRDRRLVMLRVQTSNIGNMMRLCLQGRIVIGETAALQKALVTQTEASVIVLDLAAVTAIDAHGLGVLLALRHQAESMGIEFRLVSVTRVIRRVLEITKLNSVFDVHAQQEGLTPMALARSSFRREL